MIRFLDGPAAGVLLFLKRAPVFLRAVIERDKLTEWDALDQLNDTPKPVEMVYAYKRDGEPGTVHVDFSRPRRGEWYKSADYRLCPDQPDDATLRDREKWRAWCCEQVKQKEPSA